MDQKPFGGFGEARRVALARLGNAALDKAPAGAVDAAAVPLVRALNGHAAYVTTSTCAGRCVVWAGDKRSGRWLFSSHDGICGADVRAALAASKNEAASLKFEPPLAHVRCASLAAADRLARLALQAGYRESGVSSLASPAGPLVAIRSTGAAMEVPLVFSRGESPGSHGEEGTLLLSDDYLDAVADLATARLVAARAKLAALVDAIQQSLDEKNSVVTKQSPSPRPSELFDDEASSSSSSSSDEEAACVWVLPSAARRVKVALGPLLRKDVPMRRDGEAIAIPVMTQAAAEALSRGEKNGVAATDVLRVGAARFWSKKTKKKKKTVDFRGWSRLGADALLVPADVHSEDWERVAARAGVRRLFRESEVSKGATRAPVERALLVGTDPWVEIKEGGLRLSFDATKTMFSFGNCTERLRHAAFDCAGQTVVDLYAGIGYFSLALLKAGAARLHAFEWAPAAVEALRRNLASNGFADGRATVYAEDNRHASKRVGPVAHRVSLGLTPSSRAAWPVACDVLSHDRGGVVHVHENHKVVLLLQNRQEKRSSAYAAAFEAWGHDVARAFDALLRERRPGRTWTVACLRVSKVKSYAPHVFHLVADLQCRPSEDAACRDDLVQEERHIV